jgi:hypothetical protein
MTDETTATVICEAEETGDGPNPEAFEEIEIIMLTPAECTKLATGEAPYEGAHMSAKSWPFFYLWPMLVAPRWAP